jgi:hypothetical protein
MKRVAGNGKRCFINHKRGCSCATGIFFVAEGLGLFKLENIATGWWEVIPTGDLSSPKRTFVVFGS